MNYFECTFQRLFSFCFPAVVFVVVIGAEKPKHGRVRRQIPIRTGEAREKKANKIIDRTEGLTRVMAKVQKTTINGVHATDGCSGSNSISRYISHLFSQRDCVQETKNYDTKKKKKDQIDARIHPICQKAYLSFRERFRGTKKNKKIKIKEAKTN